MTGDGGEGIDWGERGGEREGVTDVKIANNSDKDFSNIRVFYNLSFSSTSIKDGGKWNSYH